MKVICAGAPKTGTKSIAKALRILGYDPVYDAEEAVEFAFKEWEDVWEEKQPDLNVLMDTVYANVEAVVDLPHSAYFDVFLERWPDAKVILSTRDADPWFQSFKQMIERSDKRFWYMAYIGFLSPSLKRFVNWTEKIFEASTGSRIPHSFIWKLWYKRHNSYVRETVPQSQRLEYNVTQGWEPLCKFLDKPIPQEKFPFENRANDRKTIENKIVEESWIAKRMATEIKRAFAFITLTLIVLLAWLCFKILA